MSGFCYCLILSLTACLRGSKGSFITFSGDYLGAGNSALLRCRGAELNKLGYE